MKPRRARASRASAAWSAVRLTIRLLLLRQHLRNRKRTRRALLVLLHQHLRKPPRQHLRKPRQRRARRNSTKFAHRARLLMCVLLSVHLAARSVRCCMCLWLAHVTLVGMRVIQTFKSSFLSSERAKNAVQAKFKSHTHPTLTVRNSSIVIRLGV